MWGRGVSGACGLNRKTVNALKKANLTEKDTLILLREEGINRLVGQTEISLEHGGQSAFCRCQELVKPPAMQSLAKTKIQCTAACRRRKGRQKARGATPSRGHWTRVHTGKQDRIR